MNHLFLIVLCFLICPASFAQDKGKLIFEDDFNRNEKDESQEQIGKGWQSNSKARAKGHKQVDLRDGTLHIFIHQEADHAVSVRHDAAFTNGRIELRFMLEHQRDVLGLNFADLQFKEVHAGHLFKVSIAPKYVEMEDLKTGKMRLDLYTARKAKKPVAEEVQQMLLTKKKRIPHELQTNQWYSLSVEIRDATIRVSIEGKPIGEFTSAGIAHPTKRTLRLAIPKEAVVDDLKIYDLGN